MMKIPGLFVLFACTARSAISATTSTTNLRGKTTTTIAGRSMVSSSSYFFFRQYESCQICRPGSVLTNPYTTVSLSGQEGNTTCQFALAGGSMNWLSSEYCLAAQQVCECGAAPATPSAATSAATSSSGQWPDLVGMDGQQAKGIIEGSPDGRSMDVQIVPDGSMVTLDYRADRVRLYVDDEGTVTRVPIIG